MSEINKCSYCQEPAEKLRRPHTMGNVIKAICEACWNVDKETQLKVYNEDIGDF